MVVWRVASVLESACSAAAVAIAVPTRSVTAFTVSGTQIFHAPHDEWQVADNRCPTETSLAALEAGDQSTETIAPAAALTT